MSFSHANNMRSYSTDRSHPSTLPSFLHLREISNAAYNNNSINVVLSYNQNCIKSTDIPK